MAGWIKLWRKLIENGHLKMPGMAFKLWIYCLLEAVPYPDPKRNLTAGELWLSYQSIRENLGEGNRKVSMSTVSAALKYLEGKGYITLQPEKFKGIKVKVVNWADYQSFVYTGTEPLAARGMTVAESSASGRVTVPESSAPGRLAVAESSGIGRLTAPDTPTTPRVGLVDSPSVPRVDPAKFLTTPKVATTNFPTTPREALPGSPTTPRSATAESPATHRSALSDSPAPPRVAVTDFPTTPKKATTNSHPTPEVAKANPSATPGVAITDSPTAPRVAVSNSPTTLTVVDDYSQSSRPTTPTVAVRAAEPYSGKPSCSAKNYIENNIENSIVVVTVVSDFAKEFGRPLSPIEINQLAHWQKTFSADLIREALTRAALQDKRTIAYIGGILKNWSRSGLTTVEQTQQEHIKPNSKGGKRNAKGKPGYSPREVDWGNEPDTL